MRKIVIRCTPTAEGHRMRSIGIRDGGTFHDETRNTVYNVLRRVPAPWLFDDQSPILFGGGVELMVR